MKDLVVCEEDIDQNCLTPFCAVDGVIICIRR